MFDDVIASFREVGIISLFIYVVGGGFPVLKFSQEQNSV